MSFRLFVYYCALSGGCAAFLGWLVGRVATGADPVGEAGFKGFFLGLFVALALSLIDVLWNLSGTTRQPMLAIASAVVVGAFGALMGGMIGQLFYDWTGSWLFQILGWALTGLLIGVSLGAYEFLRRSARSEDIHPALGKLKKGMLGGTVGGMLGGFIYRLLRLALQELFEPREDVQFWSPTATGFVALGASIGLAIGLAQVILKEAWVKVVKGFRAGREMILSRPEITIGRAESCDIGLFGDSSIERLHARIVLQGHRYYLEDAGTPGGTFLNGERIQEATALKQGDQIQIGNSLLSFGERRKSPPAQDGF
jgi:hypothetical protein